MLTPATPRSANGNSLSLTVIWYIARPPKNWPKARLLLLRRQCLHELQRQVDPAGQLVVALDPLRLDRRPIPHRPAGDVERPDVRLSQRCFPLVGAEAGDEPVLADSDECVAVDEEAAAAGRRRSSTASLRRQDAPSRPYGGCRGRGRRTAAATPCRAAGGRGPPCIWGGTGSTPAAPTRAAGRGPPCAGPTCRWSRPR